MSDSRILIPRAESWDDAEGRSDYPVYIPVSRSKDDGGSLSAIVFCPDCKNAGFLKDHTIEGDGTVSPSILCQCGWHVWARLLDWSA